MPRQRKPKWDEPRGCTSPRGWLYNSQGECIGHYLDYGPCHYRSGHSFCRFHCECARSQPGNVHAVRFHRTAYGQTCNHQSRYFETIAQCKEWIEAYQASGMPAATAANCRAAEGC